MQLAQGTMLGPYILEGLLGAGGIAEVWAATHTILRVQVAVKVLASWHPSYETRLMREARVQAQLDHPNLLPVRDVVEVNGSVGLVLPLVRGPSLASLLAHRRPDEAESLALFEGIVAGVAHAHRSGFVHRDLKPDNVLLEPRWGRIVPRVADFGLVKGPRDGARTAHGLTMGTLAYTAPEQLRDASSVDQRADLFSLGIILVELLSGRRPFSGLSAAELVDAHRRPPDLTGVPEAWRGLCTSLLHVDPDARLAHATVVTSLLGDRARPPTDPLMSTGDLGQALTHLAPQVLTDPPPSVAPPLGTPGSGLPAEVDAFVGREADLTALAERCARHRLVSVLGPAGAGKTRLALRFAHRQIDRFPGGVVFCDLTDVRSLDGITFVVARALDVRLDQGDAPNRLGAAMATRGRCLVVLDNFEQLVEHVPVTVERWIADAPEACVVVTSRVRLGAPGEAILRLDPLPEAAAIELFAARAHQRAPGFGMDGDTHPIVAELVRRLDRLPLAIELAAARIDVMSPRDLLARLDERFRLLARSGPHRPGRQHTLRAALDASWDLLTPWEREAFAQCSVFEGGFTLEAAEAVVDVSTHPGAPWLLDVLEALVDASVVRSLGENRFGLLLSLQAYARERLDQLSSEAIEGVTRRHVAHYAQLGRAAEISALAGFGGEVRWRRMLSEIDNLVAANRRAVAAHDVEAAARTLRALFAVGERTQLDVVEPRLAPTLALVDPERDPELRAETLLMVGAVQAWRGDHDAAVAAYTAASDRYRSVENRSGQAEALRQLGSLDRKRGRTREAVEQLERAVALFHEAEDATGAAAGQASLAIAYQGLGRFDDAIQTHTEALAAYRKRGDQMSEAKILNSLGIAYHLKCRYDDALAAYDQALAVYRDTGPRFSGKVYNNLALVYEELERRTEARAAYQQALDCHRATGDRIDEGIALSNLGYLTQDMGRLDEAESLHLRALTLHRAVDNRRFEAKTLDDLALIHRLRGELDQAEARYTEALALHRAVASPAALAFGLEGLGGVYFDQGRLEEAHGAIDRSLTLARESGPKPREAVSLGIMGLVLAAMRRPRAREHAKLGHRILDRFGLRRDVAHNLTRRARIELRLGCPPAARRFLDDAQSIARELDDEPTSILARAIASARRELDDGVER